MAGADDNRVKYWGGRKTYLVLKDEKVCKTEFHTDSLSCNTYVLQTI